MSVFSENLKSLRAFHNLTQRQLGIEVGASERGIQNYELDERKPNYEIALADYFDVSIDYLVGRTNNPNMNR